VANVFQPHPPRRRLSSVGLLASQRLKQLA